MNGVIEKDIKIENMIYEIKGVEVMLDSDLAKLYECKNGTKSINLAVKRHIKRFPSRYMFQLTKEEYNYLRFQTETPNNMSRTLPYVFTEQGVAMLATVLKTKVAEEISIRIMDAFVAMRHYIIENKDIYKSLNHLNNKILEHDEKFDELFSKFDKKEQLFLEGQIYDAYSNIISIFKESKEEIIVIDQYADMTFLDLIRNIKSNIILITKNSNRLSDLEIEKYNKEYHNLKVIRNNSFHDRYFIIDRKNIYHSGTSINNAGSKIFSINKLEDEMIKETLIENVLKIIK